ncbi:nucleotidyl transferase AbiEii/AbiGii toxin family protein [Bifidobacterium saguini]|uniref:Nucleotidyl transferase AbiEii/AbiGii toxin family protein n=1 Tax=Bifidobacterium saguini TaxID=762210 RepID=A0ABX7SB26_9BIFI|nr:nucleotidyl transferase AbiEii/AbiGii toxin family protein [Bifidobacterium saguini]QTB90050.1 nucleotidyl transferase AbiEii/AbiGii toxin family protein [Bifidobacterium saguini]
MTDIEVIDPRNRPTLEKLETYPYRLYPIANQIADKVCAVVELIHGRESTRIKDLVDLVTIAITYMDRSTIQNNRKEHACRSVPSPRSRTAYHPIFANAFVVGIVVVILE